MWPGVKCGFSVLLVLVLAPRGFPPGTPVFPSPQKPTFLNSNSIRNARPLLQRAPEIIGASWVTNSIYVFFTQVWTITTQELENLSFRRLSPPWGTEMRVCFSFCLRLRRTCEPAFISINKPVLSAGKQVPGASQFQARENMQPNQKTDSRKPRERCCEEGCSEIASVIIMTVY